MNFTEASEKMKNGFKVSQSRNIFFLGKEDKSEPYTIRLKKCGRRPLVRRGFFNIDKRGQFFDV